MSNDADTDDNLAITIPRLFLENNEAKNVILPINQFLKSFIVHVVNELWTLE